LPINGIGGRSIPGGVARELRKRGGGNSKGEGRSTGTKEETSS